MQSHKELIFLFLKIPSEYALSMFMSDTCECVNPPRSVDTGLFCTQRAKGFFMVLIPQKTNNTINSYLISSSHHTALIVQTCLHSFFFFLPKLGSKHDLCITFGWYVEPTFLISSFHELKSSPNWRAGPLQLRQLLGASQEGLMGTCVPSL